MKKLLQWRKLGRDLLLLQGGQLIQLRPLHVLATETGLEIIKKRKNEQEGANAINA